MKVCTGVVAYLPTTNYDLMTLTQRSIESCKQFSYMGKVVAYHAQDAQDSAFNSVSEQQKLSTLCTDVHSSFGEVEVHEYYNGSLFKNWSEFLRLAFEVEGADWAMFVSNDVIWKQGAAQELEHFIDTLDPMMYAIEEPTAVFLMSRKMWGKLQQNWFDDYLPCSWEDMDLACQVLAAGGRINSQLFMGLLDHEIQGTIRLLGPGYRNGTNVPNWIENGKTYARRWGDDMNSWQLILGAKQGWLEEVRANPRRP